MHGEPHRACCPASVLVFLKAQHSFTLIVNPVVQYSIPNCKDLKRLAFFLLSWSTQSFNVALLNTSFPGLVFFWFPGQRPVWSTSKAHLVQRVFWVSGCTVALDVFCVFTFYGFFAFISSQSMNFGLLLFFTYKYSIIFVCPICTVVKTQTTVWGFTQ